MFFPSKQNKIIFLRKDILDFEKKKALLENINLSSKSCTILILKGKNGSGKTSLLLELNKIFSYLKLSPNNYTNLIDYYGFISIINKYFSNLINILKFKITTNKIKLLSYGYKKFYFILLNFSIKKKLFLFDEPFNGLDKYFLLLINRMFIYIHTIKSIQIKSYHNKVNLTDFGVIFLD